MHHYTQLYTIIQHYAQLYTTIQHYTPLCTIMHHYTPLYTLCTIMHHNTPLCTTINHIAFCSNDSRMHVVEPPRRRSFIWQIGVNSSIQDQRQVNQFFWVDSVVRGNYDSLLIRAVTTSTTGTLNELTTDLIMASSNNNYTRSCTSIHNNAAVYTIINQYIPVYIIIHTYT